MLRIFMRVSLRTLLFLGLGVAGVAGCARSRSSSPSAEAASPELGTDIPVEIQNRHWRDLTIYVVRQGLRTRLGTVTANRTATLLISRGHMQGYRGDIRLVADPLGSGTSLTSEPIRVLPGQIIVWTLETDLTRSSIGLRSR
jgi:hypothetical protein